ncbi:hypothetical protein CcCBS67573_g05799 [Chytriomyces confervae]|uniref:Heme haloperoxidase family profile domain-containing protein n=1 Tax=Chytriomyces confervae TaxID=246404 RepID=A0A507F8R8_9FUNG|nr:hypothetical protein HDU80_011182 [Chytriomyces hyalinus]TPX72534.1 hypothetical protein CcCBS67573_g05799 [Chytriomyces confervae]
MYAPLIHIIAFACTSSLAFPVQQPLFPVASIDETPVGVYLPPAATDIRGPCPALNTMANHGYIPRDGRHITQPMLMDVLERVLGLGRTNIRLATVAAFALKTSTWFPGVRDPAEVLEDGTPYLNLDDLNMHGRIEHDASLTRQDSFFGNNWSVDQSLLAQFKNSSSDGKVVTLDDMAAYRVARTAHSKENNPEADLSAGPQKFCWGEASLSMMIFGNSNEISIDYIESFFGQERIPDGYQKPDPPVGYFALQSHISDLQGRAN